MADEKTGLTADTFESMLDDFDDSNSDTAATDEPDAVPEVAAPVEEPVQSTEVAEEAEVAVAPPVEEPETAVEPETDGMEAEDAPPADDSDDSSEYTYVVQKGFTQEGRTFHPGETIPVKCRYCTFWEKEWLGSVRCRPGKPVGDEGDKMRADIFSCESFFVCKELEPEIDAFFSMGLAEILTVRRMLPSMRKLLATESWLNDQVDKKSLDVDKVQVFQAAKGFVSSFTSVEQLTLATQFIRSYVKTVSLKDSAKKPPLLKFESGDWVEWIDLTTKEVLKGIIITKGRGQIKVAVTEGVNAGHSWTFNFKEWCAKRSPKIVRKTVHEDVR